jgi:hypothetical protein
LADVFLSHASEDREAALAVCQALEASGLRCWMAPRDIPPSASWAAAIVDAVRQCRMTVILLSAHSLASRQVVREVELADTEKHPLLGVRMDNAQLTGELSYFLLNVQWYEAAGDYLPGLAAAVRDVLAPGPLKAIEPERIRAGSFIAAEFRRVTAAWLGVISGGRRFILTLDTADLRTVVFSVRFLVYMQIVAAVIAVSLVNSAQRRPAQYTLSYIVSGFVEAFGEIVIFHGAFRLLGGAGSLAASSTVCLLYSAFGPIATLCLSPVRSYLEPFFRMDPTKATPQQLAEALTAQWTAVGAAVLVICALTCTVVIVAAVGGMVRSLRALHKLSAGRSALAMLTALVGYLIYVLVLGTPFERMMFQ